MIGDIATNVVMAVIDAALLVAIRKQIKLVTPPRVVAAIVFGPFLLIVPLFALGLFAFFRLMAWVIFVHLVVVLAGGAVLMWKAHRRTAVIAVVASVLVAGVGIDAFFIEPHWLEVSRHRIVSAKVKRPLKIVIIADIQTDSIGAYERRALELAKAENPDLVLFAGDYIQEHDDVRRRELIRELRALLIECGFKMAVAVEGNCDSEEGSKVFEGTGVEWTRETREFRNGDIQITALSLMNSEYANDAKINRSDRFHIVLGHIPNFARGDVPADLLVAGHTHGGQVRLPIIDPLITLSNIPRSWAAGITDLGRGRTLIVSRGIGMERGRAPRLRFLCRPELVIVDVVPGP